MTMYFHRIVAILACLVASVESSHMKRLEDNIKSDEFDPVFTQEFGKSSQELFDLLNLEDMRFLQGSPMSTSTSSSNGSGSGVEGSNSGTANNSGQSTEITPQQPGAGIDPIFNQPEDPSFLPYDVNVHMCTTYDDYFKYSNIKRTLTYDYLVQVRDGSNTAFAANIASAIKSTIDDFLCERTRRLDSSSVHADDVTGFLLGFQVKAPHLKATECKINIGYACFEVIGEVDYGITEQPGKASKREIDRLIGIIIRDYTDNNVILTFTDSNSITSTGPDLTIDVTTDTESDPPVDNELTSNIPQSNQSNSSSDNKNDAIIAATVSLLAGFAFMIVGALYFRRQRNRRQHHYVNAFQAQGADDGDNFSRIVTMDNFSPTNTIHDPSIASPQLTTSYQEEDLEDVHICRSDPCPTCNRAKKVFMTESFA